MRTLAIVLASLGLAANASAQTVDQPTPASPPSVDTRVQFWAIDTGFRTTVVNDAGYDPYSVNNALNQWNLGFSRTTSVRGPFSFAPGLRWDFGSSSAKARGADADLVVHRLGIPLEARWHAQKWVYAFARVSPGVIWQRARIRDASLQEPLRDASWVFSADASLGASLLVGSFVSSASSHAPRIWLTPEIGYAYASGGTSVLAAGTDPDDDRKFGALPLGRVALRGPFFRVNATFTF